MPQPTCETAVRESFSIPSPAFLAWEVGIQAPERYWSNTVILKLRLPLVNDADENPVAVGSWVVEFDCITRRCERALKTK